MANNKKSVKKGLIIGISSVVVLMAAAYAGVGYYFHDHFYPGTVINETNFSLGTADTAEEKIKEDAEDYLLAMERSPIRDIEIKYILKQALTDKVNDREIYMSICWYYAWPL